MRKQEFAEVLVGLGIIVAIIMLYAFILTLGGCATLEERETYQRVEMGNYYKRCTLDG